MAKNQESISTTESHGGTQNLSPLRFSFLFSLLSLFFSLGIRAKRMFLFPFPAFCSLLLACLILLFASFVGAGTYVVDSKADWEEWRYPKGVVHITDDGWVRVKYFRKDINASLNANEFGGGIRLVGSNSSRAADILDGDPTTWWGPSPQDPLDKWFIEVDLGRVVSATKLRLVFAEEAKPFEQFKVYISNGLPLFTEDVKERIVGYKLLAATTQPNKRYILEYELPYYATPEIIPYEQQAAGYDASREIVRYVRIVLTAKSERPGLAELEVYSLGDNVALGTLERGGSIEVQYDLFERTRIFDGDFVGTWGFIPLGEENWEELGAWLWWDLGALFWIDKVVVLVDKMNILGFDYKSKDPLVGYRFYLSDGSKSPGGGRGGPMGDLAWQLVGDVDNYQKRAWNFEHTFPSRPARYVFLRAAYGTGDIRSYPRRIYEIQLFGQGYAPGGTLRREMIDLGRSKNLTSVRWAGQTPPGTTIEIRTKTGDKLKEIKHYFDKQGNEVTEKKYKELPPFAKGEVVSEWLPDEKDWSGWSEPYSYSGEGFRSPSPRRYLSIEARLLSGDPEAAASLDWISVSYAPPVAKSVTGEIAPSDVPFGEEASFSYAIRSVFESGQRGFDRMLIKTPSEAQLDRVRTDGAWAAIDSVETSRDSLSIWLKEPTRASVVEVRFRCRVIENAAFFEAFVARSRAPDSWQRVDPAAPGATTVFLSSLPAEDDLIRHVTVVPQTITPNGDGVNDVVHFGFDVAKVSRPRSLLFAVYTLEGEKIKEVWEGSGWSGSYRLSWDGTDGSGKKVSPGIYIGRIEIDAQAGKRSVNKPVVVLY